MRRPGRPWLAPAALGAVLLGALALPALADEDDVDLVSRASSGAAATGGGSFNSDISDEGRFVAFTSLATNLSDADQDLVIDAYLRDMATGTTILISRADGPAGAGGDDRTFLARVSSDGRYVAFDSNADNLSAIDDKTVADVFLRDTLTDSTILVTREDGLNGTPASGAAPTLSGDGHLVAFQSQDDTLSAIDNDVLLNLFVRDVVAGTTTLVSRPSGLGAIPQDASSFVPKISGDGRSVAFESDANNLTPDVTPASRDIFVRDLATGEVTLVSRATGPAGAPGSGASNDPSISADGRYVAFKSAAANLSAEDVDPVEDVFVRDLVAGTTTLVSRATGPAGAAGDAGSEQPSISDDGRYVSFMSAATNLSTEDADPVVDVFVRDLQAGTTRLVSRGAGRAGAGGTADSGFAEISADGRYVAFPSDAPNLSAEDDDALPDIFRRDVLGRPGEMLPEPVAPAGPVAQPGPVAAAPASALRPAPAARPSVRCAGRRATIVGTARRDVLRGTPRGDVIAALAGNDVVHGLGGNDVICLGAGADLGVGGAGADTIVGGPGRDRLLGGAAIDLLQGGPGPDLLIGGPGRDRLRGGPGADRQAQ